MRARIALSSFVIIGVLVLTAACFAFPTPPPDERPPTHTPPSGPGPDLETRIPLATATEEPGLRPTTSPTIDAGTGMITGHLSYPSEWIPPLRVVAFDVNTITATGSVDTQENDSSYTLALPVGTYYVVAYTMDGALAGGYSQAVLCGLTVACTDHSLIAVQVLANLSVPDIDPGDWYAPPGAFPPMP